MNHDTEQVKQLESLITDNMKTVHSLPDPPFMQIGRELKDMHDIVCNRLREIHSE